MEVLSYVNNIWIRCSKLYELRNIPYLIVKEKAFYEAKSYFKEKHNIEIHSSALESTDDHGVALVVYTTNDIDFDSLKAIPDLFKIGVQETYLDGGNLEAYLKLYISINQQMENV